MAEEVGQLIKRTYLNSEAGLAAADREYLVYPNSMLVPAEAEQEKDTFTVTYNMEGLSECGVILDMEEAERYRALANVAALEKLRDEYYFSLSPDNIMFDINLNPKIVERDAPDGGASRFIDQYKALIGAMLAPRYCYDDFLLGGGDLFENSELLAEISEAETAGGAASIILREAYRAREERTVGYVREKKGTARLLRALTAVFGVISVLSGALLGYLLLYYVPVKEAVMEAGRHYARGEYREVESALAGLSLGQIPYESKYMLARSYVATESLTEAQRSAVLQRLTMQTDERLFCFWIEVGRLEFDSATEYANQLNDKALVLFATARHLQWAQGATSMSGADKAALIGELEGEVERLKKELEESRGAPAGEGGLDAGKQDGGGEEQGGDAEQGLEGGDAAGEEPGSGPGDGGAGAERPENAN